MVLEDLQAMAANLNVDLDSLDLAAIRLPAGEDFGIISDDEDLKIDEEEFQLEMGLDNTIVVDNLPVVAKDKYEKLQTVVRKIFSQNGVIKEEWMPVDPDTQKTLGYCFIEFNTPKEAELTKKRKQGYKLDRYHTFSVLTFDDIEKYLEVPAKWVPPKIKPYTPGTRRFLQENLQKWAMDEEARDQFVIRAGSNTEVFWNDARQSKPGPVFSKSDWTESFVQWSPLGTYLATLHSEGAAVWGGASTFRQLQRYEHQEVKLIDFSPGERFLVTYSSQEPSNPHGVVIIISEVKTGDKRITFSKRADKFSIGRTGGVSYGSWPVFRWGGGREDKYFARIEKNAVLSVYETKTFSLIDKKPIAENAVDFSWSPTDSILAYFVPELGGGNQPGRVSLVQIPSKEELRQKIFYSVSDCIMYWQSNGDYLAVQLYHHNTKTMKSTHTSFVLFRMRERGIPVEDFELENKSDKIIAFAWEPKGHRFAVIHGDYLRPDVSFYSMSSGNDSGRVSKLTTLKGKQANALYWSPAGRFIVLAGLKGLNGQLEFYNVDELETMALAEHYMAIDVEWDPSGRYVVTASVHEMENGFYVWSFNGKLIYRILKDNFFQFMWRPRPPCLLTAEKKEEIAKNLKKYSKKYKAEDEDVSMLLSKQDREKRKMLRQEWQRWVSDWKWLHEEEELERKTLRDGEDSDDDEQQEYERLGKWK